MPHDNTTQTIKAKVVMPNTGRAPSPKVRRQLTFEVISEWIRLQGLDDYTTNGLIKMAANVPTTALPSFQRNFNLMIARVRKQRRLEQNQPKDKDENSDSAGVSETS